MPEAQFDVYVEEMQPVGYDAVIDQTARFDGLYRGMMWPYNHGEVAGNRDARPLHGLQVHVTREAHLNTGMTFAEFEYEGKATWIPKDGIEPPLMAATQTPTSYLAQLAQVAGHDFAYYEQVPQTARRSHIPAGYTGRARLAGQPVLVVSRAERADGRAFLRFVLDGTLLWIPEAGIMGAGRPLPLISVGGDTQFRHQAHRKTTPAVLRMVDGQTVTAQMQLQVQGNYTAKFTRQNFEFTLYTDADCTRPLPVRFGEWQPRAKYSLRGDYTDQTHARNAAGYQLWREVLAQENVYGRTVRDQDTLGTIMTQPVVVAFNGANYGIYTLSTYLDADSLKIDAERAQEILLLALDGYTTSKDLAFANATARLNDTDFGVMSGQVAGDPDLVGATNRLMGFIHDANDATFRRDADQYFDPLNLIDYLLFVGVLDAFDNATHNTLVYTYDGQHWLFSLLDLDISFDIDADGKLLADPQPLLAKVESPLLQRIWSVFAPEVKARWAELRQGTFSRDHLVGAYAAQMELIGDGNYARDQQIWRSPTGVTSSLRNVTKFIDKQLPACDRLVDQL